MSRKFARPPRISRRPLRTQGKKLATTFDTTLQNDLQNAGIFEMVSRSFCADIPFPARRKTST